VVLALLSAVLAASSGGSDLVLLFSALGGLSGLAALASVFVNYRSGQRKAQQDDKSVAIIELEKAVPGMGEIIEYWQGIVHQLQTDLEASRREYAASRAEIAALREELAAARKEIAAMRGITHHE
jgi:hypothetical protein